MKRARYYSVTQNVVPFIRDYEDCETEHAIVVGLKQYKKNVYTIEFVKDFTDWGTEDAVFFTEEEVFDELLRQNCDNFIFVHNHPQQPKYIDIFPSDIDLNLTRELFQEGNRKKCFLVDHLIIGQNSKPFSFKQNNMLNIPKNKVTKTFCDIEKKSMANFTKNITNELLAIFERRA